MRVYPVNYDRIATGGTKKQNLLKERKHHTSIGKEKAIRILV